MSVAKPDDLQADETDSVVQWIGRTAHALRTTDPGANLDDLAFVTNMVGTASVVGLGESTHGTREFFQFKHRIFRFLVEHLGFRVFALEGSLPGCIAIDAYIRGGPGDAYALVHELRFWTWDTEEVVALVEWMRAYNSAHHNALRFYGYDIQDPLAAARMALAKIGVVAPNTELPLIATFAGLITDAEGAGPLWSSGLPEEWFEAAASAAAQLRGYVVDRRPEPDDPQRVDWDLAERLILSVEQFLSMYFDNPGCRDFGVAITARDRAMADNIGWIRAREGAHSRIAVWAHNLHVSRTAYHGKYVSMGQHLDRMFGHDYCVFGFAFYRGHFQAREIGDPEGRSPLRIFLAPPPRTSSVSEVFGRAKLERFVIDLRKALHGEPVERWLKASHPLFQIGGGYAEADTDASYSPVIPAESFDALVFFDQTHAARPTPSTMRRFGLTNS
jgi:erythromycin esterase